MRFFTELHMRTSLLGLLLVVSAATYGCKSSDSPASSVEADELTLNQRYGSTRVSASLIVPRE